MSAASVTPTPQTAQPTEIQGLPAQAPAAPPTAAPSLGGLNMKATDESKAHKVSPGSLPEIAKKITNLKQQKEVLKKELQPLESKLEGLKDEHKQHISDAKKGVGFDVSPEKQKAAEAARHASALIVEVQKQIAEKRTDIAKIKEEKHDLKAAIAKAGPVDTSPLARLQQKSLELTQQLAKLESSPKGNEGAITALKMQLTALQGAIDNAKGATVKTAPAPATKPTISYPKTDAEKDKTNKEIKSLQKNFDETQAKIDKLNPKLQNLRDKLTVETKDDKKKELEVQIKALTTDKKTLNDQKIQTNAKLLILKDSLNIESRLNAAVPKLTMDAKSKEAQEAVRLINKDIVGNKNMKIASSLSDLMANGEKIVIQREVRTEAGGTSLQQIKGKPEPSNDPAKLMDEADKVLNFIDEDAKSGQQTDKAGLTQVPRTFTNAQGVPQPVTQGNMLRDASNQQNLDARLTDKQDREIKALSQNIYAGAMKVQVLTPAFGLTQDPDAAVVSSDPRPDKITWTKMADGKTKVEYDMDHLELHHRAIVQQNGQLPPGVEKQPSLVASGSLKLTVIYNENMLAESFETKFKKA